VSKPPRHPLSASALFIREWLRRPHQIGAIAPSSRHLGNAMARWLPADRDDLVVELGPGTGAITEALLAHGLDASRLVAIEKSPELVAVLRERFPAIGIITGDAREMRALLREHGRGEHRVGAVMSSLPLRQFKEEFTRGLAAAIRGLLRPGGCWVQYSYHLGNSGQHGSEHFHLRCSDIVWRNLPPARVSVYQKLAA